jgi:predicted dehydrogenase
MTHDLDILLQLTGAQVTSLSASGWSSLTPHLDLVTARLVFGDGLVADLYASRIGAERKRRFVVLDQVGVLEVDLAARSLMRIPPGSAGTPVQENPLGSGDPLMEQDRAFIEVVQNGHSPRVDGNAGREAVALASRILESIRSGSGN